MSRSRKKTSIIKDKGDDTYNKRFRRTNKTLMRSGKEPKQMREVVNSYDVCDYINAYTPSDDYYKKAKRK